MREKLVLTGKVLFAVSCGILGFVGTWQIMQPDMITSVLMKLFGIKK